MHSTLGRRAQGFLLLALLLLPLNATLLHAYGRARDRHFDPAIPPVPSVGEAVAALGRLRPDLAEVNLHTIYRADPAPRSGLACAYTVGHGPSAPYLAVVRHDIDCASCRDVVAFILVDSSGAILGLETAQPWEMADGFMSPEPVLGQFAGQLLGHLPDTPQALDGTTGATLTVQGLLQEFAGVGHWLAARQAGAP